MIQITEDNINGYIGKEVFCKSTDQTVLLRGYRGNRLAQITHPERFVKGKYPHISYDCLITNLMAFECIKSNPVCEIKELDGYSESITEFRKSIGR